MSKTETVADRAVTAAQGAIRCVLDLTKEREQMEEQRKRLDDRIVNALTEVAEALDLIAGRPTYIEVDGITYRCWLEGHKTRMEPIVIRGR